MLIELIEDIKNKNESVAVVVEGGGLRGVVSAVALNIMEEYGLSSHIKAISGTSSGALNAAYFLNSETSSLLDLYRKMASKEFIQLMNYPDLMNLDYLFEEQIEHHFPLDWNRLRIHPTNFFIPLTDIITGQGQFFKAQDCSRGDQLYRILKAAVSAPLSSRHSELIDGHSYNDGHVENAIPIKAFDVHSFDRVICLLTRKRGYLKKKTLMNSLLEKFLLKNYSKTYKEKFKETHLFYNRQIAKIKENKNSKYIPIMLEHDDFIVSKICRNSEEIEKCISSVRERFLK